MSESKKIFRQLIKGFLIIITLTIIVMVIAPMLINLELVRNNINKAVSGEIGGEIKYRRLELSYFPHPHVVIHNPYTLRPEARQIEQYLTLACQLNNPVKAL